MGHSSIKDMLLKQAYSITPESIKRLGLSYGIFLQECSEFILWAQQDRDKLSKAGLNIGIIQEAEFLLEEAQNIHALRANESKSTKEEVANWNRKKKEGIDLGKQLVHHFKYAFRHNKELSAIMGEIKFPCKVHELISNLDLLIHMGNGHTDLLDAIGFDFAIMSRVAQLAEELPNLHGYKYVASQSNPNKIKRDQIFSLLKSKVDEIRACGKYVFHNDPDRLKGYRSSYLRQKNNRATRTKKNN
ncbi:hypothetical protein SAMN06265379_103456 [Saccharicrinis carchari]|uniref:Uncharacterized protein n=1 Tax=Saccharicrinis carchari TaxID=1168039 RepID=A0A521CT15_SACCC|nr:hypothetical protein [Saccharicrinis carchari]SMO62576.1 hypothetical protein SAMN06265379_103456 [Saccharicrinis carchari]